MRRVPYLVPFLTGAVLVASCGGSSSTGLLSGESAGSTNSPTTGTTSTAGTANSAVVFDTKNANAQAHAALLTAQDVGGGGSDLKVIDDDFSDDAAIAGIKACSDATALAADEAKVRIARASRTLNRSVPNSVSLRISSIVEIYPSEAQAKTFFEKERVLETSPAGLACFDALFKASAPSFKITVRTGKPVASAGAGARDLALDDDVDTGTTKQTVHLEQHHWLQGNAIINLVVSGSPQSVTADVVKAAIARQREVANAAAVGSKR